MAWLLRSMLQVCGSLVAGGASLVAGGCVPVAGGASWHPRPHIASGHPGRGTHPLPSAAALAVEIQVSKE